MSSAMCVCVVVVSWVKWLRPEKEREDFWLSSHVIKYIGECGTRSMQCYINKLTIKNKSHGLSNDFMSSYNIFFISFVVSLFPHFIYLSINAILQFYYIYIHVLCDFHLLSSSYLTGLFSIYMNYKYQLVGFLGFIPTPQQLGWRRKRRN